MFTELCETAMLTFQEGLKEATECWHNVECDEQRQWELLNHKPNQKNLNMNQLETTVINVAANIKNS